MVKTPVLFITFARPDYARKTFEGIKAAKPEKLYFYSNKGREDIVGEVNRNEEIRSYIKEIDWDCELHTFFRDECVDVYNSIRGAITWLFQHEESGIILEEDCVPTRAFFSFADQMICKYQDNNKVWYISGDNFYNLNPSGYDYIFSQYHCMYGWATWRNRWQQLDWDNFTIEAVLKSKCFNRLYKTHKQALDRKHGLQSLIEIYKRKKSWDYLLGCTVDYNYGVGVFPTKQLIHNIGLSGVNHNIPQVSYVNSEPTYCGDKYEVVNHPPIVEADIEYDYQFFRSRWNEKNFIQKILYYLYFLIPEKTIAPIKDSIKKIINYHN